MVESFWLLLSAMGGTLALLLLTGGLLSIGVGAALGIMLMLLAMHRAPKLDESWRRRLVGLALLIAWWGGMLVATPFYTPYPRLALPLLVATWLTAALHWDDSVRHENAQWSRPAGHLSGCVLIAIIFIGWLLLMPLVPHADHLSSQSDRRGLVDIARQIRQTGATGQTRAVYVFGEPAMLFQLRAVGEPLVVPVQALPASAATASGQPIESLVIAGPHAARDPDFQRQLAAAGGRWKLVQDFDYQPSSVVWLDLNDPRRSPNESANLDRVQVYRFGD